MHQRSASNTWFWVAVAAIAVAIALLLAPHPAGAPSAHFLAILPVLFVGLLAPLSLLSPLARDSAPCLSEAPIVPASFQRPPPCAIA